MEKKLAPDLPRCRADAHLIEEVLLNLITNATQALENTDDFKYIEISSAVGNSAIVAIVSDSGPGVAPEHGDSIFDPFFTTKTDGAGIGLSLAHRIVADHGGALSVTTSKWGGAEFIMEIPIS
jgi:C4-dicarboxylate-specific signal transduction histidine kinase